MGDPKDCLSRAKEIHNEGLSTHSGAAILQNKQWNDIKGGWTPSKRRPNYRSGTARIPPWASWMQSLHVECRCYHITDTIHKAPRSGDPNAITKKSLWTGTSSASCSWSNCCWSSAARSGDKRKRLQKICQKKSRRYAGRTSFPPFSTDSRSLSSNDISRFSSKLFLGCRSAVFASQGRSKINAAIWQGSAMAAHFSPLSRCPPTWNEWSLWIPWMRLWKVIQLKGIINNATTQARNNHRTEPPRTISTTKQKYKHDLTNCSGSNLQAVEHCLN